MAKRETKETYKDTRSAANATTGQYMPIAQAAGAQAAGFEPAIQEQKDFLTGGYKAMMEPPQQFNAHTIGNVGAVDVSDAKNTIEGYKAFRDTGGLSSENIERMRGMGGFDEFAKTGGYTDKSIANIKAQALSPIGSYATGTRDELARRAAVQGGYAPGFDAANRQLRRDTSRAIADTSLNANVAIQDRINAGRQWGISGLTGAEQALAGMQTGNRLAALGGEGNMSSIISNASAADRANELAVSQYNAGALSGADLFNIQNAQNQEAAGMAGLTGLYAGDIGRQESAYGRETGALNAMNAAKGNFLGTQTQTAIQPGIGGNIMNAVGTAAGIAGGAMLGGMGSGAAMSGMGGIGSPGGIGIAPGGMPRAWP